MKNNTTQIIVTMIIVVAIIAFIKSKNKPENKTK